MMGVLPALVTKKYEISITGTEFELFALPSVSRGQDPAVRSQTPRRVIKIKASEKAGKKEG